MAIWQLYKCNKCSYNVMTEPQGFYPVMSGQYYYNFKCKKCKEIVNLSSKDIGEMGYLLKCPKCGEDKYLSTWNPVEGKCPRCNARMTRVKGIIINAD